MQSHGKYLWMMQGMFKGNGGCGYVKKPDVLLSIGPDGEIFDPCSQNLPIKTTLKVLSLSMFLLCLCFIRFLKSKKTS